MTNFLDRYLTEYDSDLSPESYIDPVGTLIIWSAFGREVFKNRINSVSNDVRNYTINLFHQFLVRKLVNDDAVKLSSSLQRRYPSKQALKFKQACLIFLENLFVYSILQHEATEALETTGILGIANARRRWSRDEGNPILVFTHESAGQILVRQLSLGVSGRYKTPLMNIGFFDNDYHYNKPAGQARWADAEALIVGAQSSLLGKLERVAYALLTECVSKLRHGEKLLFAGSVPRKLTMAYARAFASSRVVGGYSRDFWLRQTGLNGGAAGALLGVLKETEESLPAKQVLEWALAREMETAERAKLQRIANLEPFLSDCSLLFTIMAAVRTHSIDDVAAQWKRFGRDEERLPRIAQPVVGHASLNAVKGSAAAHRLVQLQRVANAGSFGQQVRSLAEYHRAVMQSRGQVSWLDVEANDTIKVHARTLSLPDPKNWQPDAWYNEYYFPQFRHFVAGLLGGDV